MSNSWHRVFLSVVFFVLTLAGGVVPPLAAQAPKIALSATPTIFEKNQGQIPPEYQFLARRNGIEAFYFSRGIDIFVTQSPSAKALVRISWVDAKGASLIVGEDQLPGNSNYFRGTDASRWIRGVPQFGRIRYQQIYHGIDLLFHGHGHELEYDFVVQPGADSSKIGIRLDRPFHVTGSGDLEIELGKSALRIRKPIAYQQFGTKRNEVTARFVLAGDREVKISVGAYDHGHDLVIDPILSFATYLAGTGNDQIKAVTTDAAGNIYLTGYTTSADFPLVKPEQKTFIQPDAFVVKLDPTGNSLLFSTYVGGSNGAQGSSIVVDPSGNVLVGGISNSSDFPHAGSVQSPSSQINANEFFLLSLTPDGSTLNYSGLIGGGEGSSTNGNNGLIAADAAGNAYLTGVTADPQFQLTPSTLGPTMPGNFQDAAFVLKVDPTGKLVYSTIIPGSAAPDPSFPNNNNFPASGISVDPSGQVTLAGTGGVGLPTTPSVLQGAFPNALNVINRQAGYVLQLNPTASALNYATYLRGTDRVGGFAVDSLGNSFVTGSTSESNLPVSANAYQKTLTPGPTCSCNDGYIMEVNGQGTSVLAATYLGGTPVGNGGEFFTGITLDSHSNVFVGGMSSAPDFPLQNPFSTTLQFSIIAEDMVLAEMSPDLSSLLFGSFLNSTSPLGGSQFSGLTMDGDDHPIVAGETFASDFPTTPNTLQLTLPTQLNKGETFPHGFIAKLDLSVAAPSVCFAQPSIDFGSVLVGRSATQNLQVKNCGNAPLQFTMNSSVATIAAKSTCGSTITQGSSCTIQVTFSPVDSSVSAGALTFADNAAIGRQTVGVTGKGGLPQIFFPPSYSTADLVVGSQAPFPISFLNSGDGTWIVSSATATGDFSVRSACTNGAAPHFSCSIGIVFAPTVAGLRTGTLTINDNAAGSPHVIQLSGSGLTIYPTPSVSSIAAIAMDSNVQQVLIFGTNFFPASQVFVNRNSRKTFYGFGISLAPNSPVATVPPVLFANLTSSDLVAPTELQVTVSNPSPGGGVSNSYPVPVYAAIRNTIINDAVWEPHAGLLYASTSTASATDPNQLIAIDPNTQKIVSNWTVGNGPNHLAVSDDGQLLYVGLDGDKTVAQVSLASGSAGTVNFTVDLGNDPTFHNPMVADALRVLPGQPHSWAVTLCATGFEPCGEGVAVFDDAKERPTIGSGEPDALLFIKTDTTHLYGATRFQDPPTLFDFAISGSGISLSSQSNSFSAIGGGTLDTDGTSIYSAGGEVINPSNLALESTFQNVVRSGASLPAIKVDAPASNVYFAGAAPPQIAPGEPLTIQAFDLVTQQLKGTITMTEISPASTLSRWGTDGLIVTEPNAIFVLRTSLTSGTTPPAQFEVAGLSPATVPSGSADTKVTISGGGFGPGDSVTVNGTALQITSMSATQISVVVPASLFRNPGNVALTITNPVNQSDFLVLVVTPGAAPTAAVSTKALMFDPLIVGSASPSQTVTIANQGNAVLLISGISISGADFTQTNNCSSVSPAASCTVSIIFEPSAMGNRSAILTINDNDASGSQTVTLGGNGTDIQITAAGTSGTNVTVMRGQQATYSLSIVPEAGFAGQVTFACSNLPQFASCNIDPVATVVSGAAPVNITVAISTSQGPTSSVAHDSTLVFAGLSWLTVLGLLPLSMRIRALHRRAMAKLAVALVVTVLAAAAIVGCSGGGSAETSTTPTQTASTVTPPGTYTVNFVAKNSGISRTTPLTLVVQ